VSNPKSDPIKEVDCDYITATATQGEACTGLHSFGRYLVRDEARRGAKMRNSKAGGYYTEIAGSASIGRRFDGVCLRASGHVAAEHWQQIVDLSTNVTRFDMQVTTRCAEGAPLRLKRVWAGRNGESKAMGRPSAVKAIVGPRGIETIMLGARASQRYGRIYDKHAESGLSEYLGCVRWEVELKAELARSIAHSLCLAERFRPHMAASVIAFVHERINWNLRLSHGNADLETDVSLLRSDYDRLRVLPDCRCPLCQDETSNKTVVQNERALAFVSKCIKPTIRRLMDAGLGERVFESLGLSEYWQQNAANFCVLESPEQEVYDTQ